MKEEKIKIILYKNNPEAKIYYVTKNGILYTAEYEEMAIMFVVPLQDIGDGKFSPTMDSKLLIRYLNTVNQITDN